MEKYQNGKLQDWIHQTPEIFHDEMNGYDFELLFSGIEDDFERIRKVFREVGVKEDEVDFFFKKELENPVIKNRRINEFLEWLEQHPNRRFHYLEFKENNRELLENPYSFIKIMGYRVEEIILADEKIAVENIEDARELHNTNLKNIPILFCIDTSNLTTYRENLMELLTREDVRQNQIFFQASGELSQENIERVLQDLGVDRPQMIENIEEQVIRDYFQIYPMTDYIKDFLDVFRIEKNKIKEILEEENQKNALMNQEIHKKIDHLEQSIERLKRQTKR